MKRYLLILALALVAAHAHAQRPASNNAPAASPPARPTPPAGPLLQPAPEFSAWEIRIIYPEESAAVTAAKRADNARRLVQINTTKTGRVVHEVTRFADDRQTDIWDNGPLQYEKQTGASYWTACAGRIADRESTGGKCVAPTKTGFRDLDWVNACDYVGTVAFREQKCLVFAQVGAEKVDADDADALKRQLDALPVVAYIDTETRLPVSLRMGRTVHFYRFGSPPTAMQTLPADLTAEIKKGEDARLRTNTLAPRPY